MSHIPAFPTENERQTGPSTCHYEGMTLLDYFAAKAMQAMLSKKDCELKFLAEDAYSMASSMMQARPK